MTKRAVLTGATGFVGANLARRLLADGHEVHLLVREGHNPWRIEAIRPDVRLHVCNLGDRAGLETLLGTIRPDWVFHLAVHGAYSWQSDPAAIVQTNLTGTINLIEASLKVSFEAFVNTGSSSEYGWKDHAPTEDEAVDPNSYYAVSKASATHYCRYSAIRHGQWMPTLRLYSVYGPFEEPGRLMPTLVLKGLDGALPPLVNPDIARDYVFTDDVSDAFVRAATMRSEDWGAIYNVGTGEQTSLRQLVELARSTLPIQSEPVWGSMAGRDWDTSIWVANADKIRRDLNWHPSHSLEAGFRAMVAWFEQNRALYSA